MADEELIAIGAQDNFSAVLDKAADAAEAFAKRVNAAFSTIKPGEAKEKIDKLGEGIAQAGEKAGSAAKAIGSQFGEGGRILGEIAEAAVQSVAGIGAAFLSLRGKGGEAAKEIDQVAEHATKAEKAIGAGGLLSAISGIASRLGPLGKAGIIGGTAAIGASAFGLEQSEELEKMAVAAGTTLEEFLKLVDASKEAKLSIGETAALFTSLRSNIHESAIAGQEIAEQWKVTQERITLINDRIKQGTIERAEAEHSAADQSRDDQHSVEQAALHLQDVQEQNRRSRSDDAKNLAAHGGKPRTLNEQVEARRQEAYEREKQNRAELEAARALAEAQHKQADDARKADEDRSARNLQATREQTLLDRVAARERIEAISVEQRSPPAFRALLAEGRQQGITDLGKNIERANEEMKKLDAGTLEEGFRRIQKAVDSLPQSNEKMRLGAANFGDAAAKIIKDGGKLSEAIAPDAFEKFQSVLKASDVEAMAERMGELTKAMVDLQETAIQAGTKVSDALEKIKKSIDESGVNGILRKVLPSNFFLDAAEASNKKTDAVVEGEKESTKSIGKTNEELREQSRLQKDTKDAAVTASSKVREAHKATEASATAATRAIAQENEEQKKVSATPASTKPRDPRVAESKIAESRIAGSVRDQQLKEKEAEEAARSTSTAVSAPGAAPADAGGVPADMKRFVESDEASAYRRAHKYRGSPFDSGGLPYERSIKDFEGIDVRGILGKLGYTSKSSEQTREEAQQSGRLRLNPFVDQPKGVPLSYETEAGDFTEASDSSKGRAPGQKETASAGSIVSAFAQALDRARASADSFAQRFGGEPGNQPMRQGTVDRASQEDIEAATKSAAAQEGVATAADRVSAAFSRLSGSASSASGGEGRASGGPISGSGGPTSDSIPIMASHGEYVVNARQTAKHYSLVKAINEDRLGGFAFGGLVLDLPRFAAGGDVDSARGPSALHPVTIKLPGGESIDGFHGSPSAIEAMSRYAVMRQASSTMKSKPRWQR